MYYLLTGVNNVVLGLERTSDDSWEYRITELYQSSKVYAETPAKQGYPVLVQRETGLEFVPEEDLVSAITGSDLEWLLVIFDDELEIATHEGRVHLWSVQLAGYAVDAEFAATCTEADLVAALKELTLGVLKRQTDDVFGVLGHLSRSLTLLREQGWDIGLGMCIKNTDGVETVIGLTAGTLKVVASRHHEGRVLVHQGEEQLGN